MITLESVKRRILVVDDNPDMVKILSGFLTERGFELFTAFNGREAIESARSKSPELVLLDLNLPDMAGKEILKRLRDVNEDTVIIVITGYGGERVAIDLMKAGAIDFISKPFEMEVLLGSIKDALAVRDARRESKWRGELLSLEKLFPFFAHEIRNPLHAISGALAVIERRVDLKDEYLARSTKIIGEEVRHLTDFVQNCLLFVNRPGRGHFVEGQVNEIIPIVMNSISYIYEELSKKIKVTYRLSPKLPRVFMNYEEIKQAFLNLVKNSYESMPDGGELTIETDVAGRSSIESVVVSVGDSGSGIRKEDMNRLFDPFFTTKVKGSGLGLAICRRIIVERHNGKIKIESEGKGTKVVVELPVLRPQESS